MPRSITSAFDEREDFEAALRAGCRGLVVTGRGQFRAQLTLVTLHRLRLSAVEELLSRIAFVSVPAGMLIATFLIGDGACPVRGGVRARRGEILILPPGERLHVQTDGRHRWGSIWIPVEDLVEYGGALTGTAFTVPPVVRRWYPPASAGRHLRSLHAAVVRMVARRPGLIVDARAAHGLEQQLIHALVECLSAGSGDQSTPIERQHQDIMVRFERLIQAQPDRDLSTAEICAALDVSERLLRRVCAQHLGMGPIAYDHLRRMSLVRRTLRRSDGGEASVCAVALRYGFRTLGRFTVNYRAVFGESPHTTLRRAQDRSMIGS